MGAEGFSGVNKCYGYNCFCTYQSLLAEKSVQECFRLYHSASGALCAPLPCVVKYTPAPGKFPNPKIALKPAPTPHCKTMTVQLLYHHGFFILPAPPHSRTLPTSPAVAFSNSFYEGFSEGGIPRKISGKFFDLLLCELRAIVSM